MITINKKPGERILELGGGANRNPASDVNVDVRQCFDPAGNPTVDIAGVNLEEPLPIQSGEWDGVFSQYCIEHLSFRKVPGFLSEVFRVLKPGGKAIIVTADSEAQSRWIADHPDGWDGKNVFEAASELIYGSQDYDENVHKSRFYPAVMHTLLSEAGFQDIRIQPYGERDTDMAAEATKPGNIEAANESVLPPIPASGPRHDQLIKYHPGYDPAVIEQVEWENAVVEKVTGGQEFAKYFERAERPAFVIPSGQTTKGIEITGPVIPSVPREQLFGKDYFNGGRIRGGYAADMWGAYRDFPVHEVTFRHVMARKPESVLELGCGRGYVLKRIQDGGVHAAGLEISKHCWLTRVADGIDYWDLCKTPWKPVDIDWTGKVREWEEDMPDGSKWKMRTPDDRFDLCFSIATLEHIPEEHLPAVFAEMKRTCKRGLHGIDFGEKDDGFDQTHKLGTMKPWGWWRQQFDAAGLQNHEVVDKELLERIPAYSNDQLRGSSSLFDLNSYYNGDGKLKLNVGCWTTMFHHGWINIDVQNPQIQPGVGLLSSFAEQNKYRFQQWDVRNGLPYPTGGVDLIFALHFIGHLTYEEGVKFLRECRRVIKPDGAVRLVTPDTGLLLTRYHNYLCNITGDHSDFGKDLLDEFDEINEGCAAAPTAAGKLWALLFAGHQSCYDQETLAEMLRASGFEYVPASFRQGHPQILRETLDIGYGLSLFAEARPLCV